MPAQWRRPLQDDLRQVIASPQVGPNLPQFMQHFGKRAIRAIKEFTKGYSDTQLKVRDATSNEPWGPSDTQMNEIAEMTYNQDDYVEILEMLYKRLNEKGKNWRHVFKVRRHGQFYKLKYWANCCNAPRVSPYSTTSCIRARRT